MESISLAFLLSFYESNRLLVICLVMAAVFLPGLFLVKFSLFTLWSKFFNKFANKYSKILKKYNFNYYFVHIFTLFYIISYSSLLKEHNILPVESLTTSMIRMAIAIYGTLVTASLLVLIINISGDIYNSKSIAKKIPISLHTNILKILVGVITILTVISHILHISIAALFTSIGAAAAVLTFVFKDTAIGLIAGLQLTMTDIIRIGDGVIVPNYNAEGVIEKITITNIFIRNYDQTVSIIPSANLISAGFKNSRHMQEAGARKIKRDINIDIRTIRNLTQDELNHIQKSKNFTEFCNKYPELFQENSCFTNLKLFRKYIYFYLTNHPMIHHEEYMLMIRLLDPKPTEGLPIEIHAFSKETNLVEFERIQTEITEYMLISLKEFDLKCYTSLV